MSVIDFILFFDCVIVASYRIKDMMNSIPKKPVMQTTRIYIEMSKLEPFNDAMFNPSRRNPPAIKNSVKKMEKGR